ncbi:MAG: hypothetical protein QOF51_1062 [Chloroflexota bacterium]|jgi:hypothetical protein|nr:hypothetical protein [Chloroflexota bacterium]
MDGIALLVGIVFFGLFIWLDQRGARPATRRPRGRNRTGALGWRAAQHIG